MKVRAFLVGMAIVAGMMVAAPAADALVFNLTSDHCTGGCGTPPFGTVTLTQNGTAVDVTVHLNSPNQFVKTGSVDFQAFKFNAVGVVLGDITVNQTVPGQTLVADAGAFNGDGTGPFGFGIACSTCSNGSSNSFSNDVIFHVADATIADLTHPNFLGNAFVADIIGSTGNTGPVDVSGQGGGLGGNLIPEPATLLLLGSGLFGLGLAGRVRNRLRKK
jgi:PEP-CTERM motif